MGITAFIASFFLIAFLYLRKKIKIFSAATIFILFSLLYSIAPYLASIGIYPASLGILTLVNNEALIDIHLFNVGLSIISFLLFYLIAKRTFNNKNKNLLPIKSSSSISAGDKFLLGIYGIIYIPSLYLAFLYPWGGWSQGGELIMRSELVNSFLGNIKIILSIIVLIFFCKKNFSKLTIFLIFTFTFFTFVEHSRTQLVNLMFAILILSALHAKMNFKRLFFITLVFILFIGFLLWIALLRIGFNISDGNFLNILYPVYMEGIYGSYMALQIYDLTWVNESLNYTYGLQYITDPLLHLVPRFFYVVMGLNKDTFNTYSDWSKSAEAFLSEPLGPYGGFYYVADAFLAFSFFGPPLISSIFGFLTGKLENYAYSSFFGFYFYGLFLLGGFITFIKHPISQSTHFLFITVLFGFLFLMISNYSKDGKLRHNL